MTGPQGRESVQEIPFVELLRIEIELVQYPPGRNGTSSKKVLSLRRHRTARTSPLVLVLGLVLFVALASAGCAATGKTGATGQTGQTGQTGATGQAGLVISEVMSKNMGSLTAPDGSTPDWIELYNAGGKAINLKGYMLSDNARKPEYEDLQGGLSTQ